ncbi:MAG: class I tRNA ligase family protein, partial [Longicatena sp.]
HGADSLRVYEMFMGPLEAALPWSTTGLDGARRWIDRVYRLFTQQIQIVEENDGKLDRSFHALVKKVTNDVDTLNLNTAISAMMVFVNDCYKSETICREYAEGFVKMFACFAPHVGEELWATVFHYDTTIAYAPWPICDESKLIDDVVEVIVQVNGKLRGKFSVPVGTDEEEIKATAMDLATVQAQIVDKTVRKVIVVKGKVVNIVAN